MSKRRYAEEIEKGVGYLDVTYDRWWLLVDVAKLSMWSPRTHVLAQIRHELYYETPEFMRRVQGWQYEHGFDIPVENADWTELNTTWALRINELRFERSVSAS